MFVLEWLVLIGCIASVPFAVTSVTSFLLFGLHMLHVGEIRKGAGRGTEPVACDTVGGKGYGAWGEVRVLQVLQSAARTCGGRG